MQSLTQIQPFLDVVQYLVHNSCSSLDLWMMSVSDLIFQVYDVKSTDSLAVFGATSSIRTTGLWCFFFLSTQFFSEMVLNQYVSFWCNWYVLFTTAAMEDWTQLFHNTSWNQHVAIFFKSAAFPQFSRYRHISYTKQNIPISSKCCKRPHVDIFICMTRKRVGNRGILNERPVYWLRFTI